MSETGMDVGQERPMPSGHSVLVVEDDPDVRELLTDYLGTHGFTVHAAGDAGCARRMLDELQIDIAVLDLNLPDEDGFDLVRDASGRYGIALIVVSARSEPVDRIIGIEIGADDYLAKPFDPRELLARLRRILKRRQPPQPPPPVAGGRRGFLFAGLLLEPAARRLSAADGAEIPLTSGEFDLLCALVEQPQQVLSRTALMLRTQGRRAGPFDRSIDVQIGRLRRKLAVAVDHELIRSVRHAGYILTVPSVRC
jgi:two-component system, OmpR family, response regulator